MKEPSDLMFRDLRGLVRRQLPLPSETLLETIVLLEHRMLEAESLLLAIEDATRSAWTTERIQGVNEMVKAYLVKVGKIRDE